MLGDYLLTVRQAVCTPEKDQEKRTCVSEVVYLFNRKPDAPELRHCRCIRNRTHTDTQTHTHTHRHTHIHTHTHTHTDTHTYTHTHTDTHTQTHTHTDTHTHTHIVVLRIGLIDLK